MCLSIFPCLGNIMPCRCPRPFLLLLLHHEVPIDLFEQSCTPSCDFLVTVPSALHTNEYGIQGRQRSSGQARAVSHTGSSPGMPSCICNTATPAADLASRNASHSDDNSTVAHLLAQTESGLAIHTPAAQCCTDSR